MATNPHTRPIVPSLERHTLSSLFGDMPEAELMELVADIKANGLREPIVLHEGQVLDGWHRYRALCLLGRKLNGNNSYAYDSTEDGESPEKYVHSKNLYRRQLPVEERVRLAAASLGYAPGRGRKRGPSQEDVAKLAKVSVSTVRRALENPEKKEKAPVGLAVWMVRRAKLQKQLEEVDAHIAALTPAKRTRK